MPIGKIAAPRTSRTSTTLSCQVAVWQSQLAVCGQIEFGEATGANEQIRFAAGGHNRWPLTGVGVLG